MKPFRLILVVAAAVVAMLAIATAVLFSRSFQTWAARRALAGVPHLHATVGEVSAGWRRVTLTDVRLERDGAVLTVPRVELELPVLTAAIHRQIFLSRLTAHGWNLTLPVSGGAPAAGPVGTTNAVASRPMGAASGFAGVFGGLQVPVDVSLDGIDLAGAVVLPERHGRVAVTVRGGGIGAGRHGNLEFTAKAALEGEDVSGVDVTGTLQADMASPRTFSKLATAFVAAARGGKYPNGVKLTAEAAAVREGAGESYVAAIVADKREILRIAADLPTGAARLAGTWKMAVGDTDLAPFLLGRDFLPVFRAAGEGRFDTDTGFTAVHAAGHLESAGSRLQVFAPGLDQLGEIKVAADFDLAGQAGAITVQRLEATIATDAPVASVRTLQAFNFNPSTAELRGADVARDLFAVALVGVPVAWSRPFLKHVTARGGKIRGELVGAPRAGGVALHTTVPLTLDGVTIEQEGKPLVSEVSVAFNASGDYSPTGWQAEVAGLTLKRGAAVMLGLDAKAGQLAGPAQPLKTTGKFTADLAGLLAQPIAQGRLLLTSGQASGDFAASFDGQTALHAKIGLKELATTVADKPVTLPEVAADVRIDLSADGTVTFNAPLALERNGRKSDLTVEGTLGAEKDKSRALDARLTSTQFVVDDAQVFAAVLPAGQKKNAAGANVAPWSGVHGSVALQLARVIYSDQVEATGLTGRLRLDAGSIKLEGLQANLGDAGRGNLDGMVTFNGASPQPYALEADVAVHEFDPAPLFRSVNGQAPATIEGKFDILSKVAARGRQLGELAEGAGGEFQLTSRGGVFRGLPVNATKLVENSSRLSAWIASAGTALSTLAGKKEYQDIASKAQAVAEFAKGLNPIAYDQLSVVLSRDAALNTTLKDFTLISPQLRLTGGGTALHQPGTSLLDDSLAMEFKLRAQGRQGELLKYLGVLEPQPDNLGYVGATLPLKISGTLRHPDPAELNGRLAALAMDKSGLTDKAAELFNKVFGSTK
jgi:hypothetical protein